MKKSLVRLALIGALGMGITGCDIPKGYQEGKVIKESGTIINLVESKGALFGNESVKFGDPTYILTVETDKGKYIIDVRGHYSRPLAALAEAIEVGDRVKFMITLGKSNYFSKDKIGSLNSTEIELLGK